MIEKPLSLTSYPLPLIPYPLHLFTMTKRKQFQFIVQQGFQLLKAEKLYKQVDVLGKLQTLGYEISPASLSNILKNKKTGDEVLKKAAKGIKAIIGSELAFFFDETLQQFIPNKENQERVIISAYDPSRPDQQKKLRYLANGRPRIQEKLEFLETAQNEIVEMGLRLRTFTDYFFSRNEHEFAIPIKQLMKKGVQLKLYLLDPDSNAARLYFEDRSLADGQEEEKESSEIIKRVIRKLKKLKQVLKEEGLAENLRIYAYRHIPYNHFLIVDGHTQVGKMMISHYMYGIKRADCPVVEFSRQADKDLYRKYWKSFQALIQNAKRIDTDEE